MKRVYSANSSRRKRLYVYMHRPRMQNNLVAEQTLLKLRLITIRHHGTVYQKTAIPI
jgi:hypothetical protein